MTLRKTVANVVSLSLLTFCSVAAQAQVTLPVPDHDVKTLVTVLELDGLEFEKAKACQQLSIVGDATAVPALAALLSDEHLSTYARSALENLDAPEANQALLKACDTLKGNQLIGVIHSLGKRKDPASMPTLVKLLKNDAPAVKVAAARAIANQGTAEAAKELRVALKNAPGPRQHDLARACLSCAHELLHSGEHEQAVSLTKAVYETIGNFDIEQMASLNWIQPSGKVDEKILLDLLASGDPSQIRTGLYAARRMEVSQKLVIELAEVLKKQSPQNQVLLLELLADIGNQRILPALLMAAESKDVDVRVAAINALANLDVPSSLPTLLAAANSPQSAVAEAANSAIVSMNGNEIDANVVKMLGDQDKRTITSAIEIAAGRRIASSVPQLMQLASHPDQQIRNRAIHAIGQAASVEHFSVLMELMNQSVGDESTAAVVKQSLQSAFLRMPQEKCAQKLTSAMRGASQKTQVKLLEQLAAIGGPTALKTVVSAAKSNVDFLQDAATRLLGEWLTADAAPQMFELLKSLPKGKYQTRVLRGYIRIARQLDMSMDQRMEVCRNALAAADRKDEKLLVLAVLRRHRSREGIAIAKSLLSEPGLIKQAQSTVARIRENLGPDDETGFVSLFDGKTLDGWKEHTAGFWRVENGAIVGGDLKEKVKQNEFLRSRKTYGDFELRLQFKLSGEKTNAGVQFRTAEIPDDHEVSGYQADLGDGWWGCLYDESRRRKVLAGPPTDKRAAPVRRDQWNDYRIRCEGKRIQLWINDVQTVDYTEPDPEIPLSGIIALQVHGNLINEAHYRNIRIKSLR